MGQQATHAAVTPVTGTQPDVICYAASFAWSELYMEVISLFPLVYLATDECFWAKQVFK